MRYGERMGMRLRLATTTTALALAACAGAPPRATPLARPAAPPPAVASAAPTVAIAPEPVDPPDLLGQVARLRGLTPKRAVDVRYLDDAAFDAQYAVSVPVADDVRHRIVATWTAFGFIGGGTEADPGRTRTTAFSGFYDPKLGQVFLRDRADRDSLKSLTVHELTHALQDQTFGLASFSQDGDDDAMLARKATFEGDATLVAEIYGAKEAKDDPEVSILRASGRATTLPEDEVVKWIGADLTLIERPAIAWRPLVFAYYGGMSFLSAVQPPYDFHVVDAVYRDPPTTTEQVMHPEKYRAHEARLPLEAKSAPAGTTVVAEGTLGEYRAFLFLLRCVPRDVAARAAAGWGNDHYVVASSTKDKLSLTWTTRWDTEADAQEFEHALATAAKCYPAAATSGLRIASDDAIARDGDRVTYVRGVKR